MLIDCQKCHFKLETYYEEMTQGFYTYTDFACMSPAFLAHHPFEIGELNSNWNVLDRADKNTKLIHYTNLYTQPWKSPNHPYGELWFTYFREAIKAGHITQKDIELSKVRSYVRPDIMKGNSPSLVKLDSVKQVLSLAKRSAKRFLKPELV